jgi:uncharacterized membrane protein YeaQ/YmgE (transglycosylase-associated protein family)
METFYCIVGLIVSVICGAASASIMKSKGRSSGAGWALGLLLGIIGLIISAVLPKDEAGTKIQMLESGMYMECPYCRSIIDRKAIICPQCRSQLK